VRFLTGAKQKKQIFESLIHTKKILKMIRERFGCDASRRRHYARQFDQREKVIRWIPCDSFVSFVPRKSFSHKSPLK